MVADRRFSIPLMVLLLAAVVAVPKAFATRSASPVPLPTLYVQYTNQCSFTVVNDAGQTVTSIAPGQYELDVSTPIMFRLLAPGGPSGNPNDFTGCKGWVQFQMTGPGVSVFTTLDNGCSSDNVLGTWKFQPSSTYTLEDMNQPAATKMTITTLAGGTPQLPTKTPYDTTSGTGTLSTDLIGSSAPVRATLEGKLAANGKLTLTLRGKPVSKLQVRPLHVRDLRPGQARRRQPAGERQERRSLSAFRPGVRRHEEDHGVALDRSLDRLRARRPRLHAHRLVLGKRDRRPVGRRSAGVQTC